MADRWRCRVRRRNRAAGSGPRVAGAHRSGHGCLLSGPTQCDFPPSHPNRVCHSRNAACHRAWNRGGHRSGHGHHLTVPTRYDCPPSDPNWAYHSRNAACHRAWNRDGHRPNGCRASRPDAHPSDHGHRPTCPTRYDCRPNGPNPAYHSRNAACHRAWNRGAHRSGHDYPPTCPTRYDCRSNGPNPAYHSRNEACHRAWNRGAHRSGHDCPPTCPTQCDCRSNGPNPAYHSRNEACHRAWNRGAHRIGHGHRLNGCRASRPGAHRSGRDCPPSDPNSACRRVWRPDGLPIGPRACRQVDARQRRPDAAVFRPRPACPTNLEAFVEVSICPKMPRNGAPWMWACGRHHSTGGRGCLRP